MPSQPVEIGRLIAFVEAQAELDRAIADRERAGTRYRDADHAMRQAWDALKPAEQKSLNTFYGDKPA